MIWEITIHKKELTMAKTIEPTLRKIGDYLELDEDAVFVIPEYQRAYSWGTDRCDKLWSDIVEYSENTNKDAYFFGTVILNCQNNDEELLLIDGQQRTTTFFLLLKAFLIRINNAIRNTEKDEDSKKLCRALRERRKDIMSILYRIDTDEIPDELDDTNDMQIFENYRPLLQNKSIREQYRNDFNAILKSMNLEQAESRVEKIKYKQKDNRYSNYFRNFKFFYLKANELADSELNQISKIFIEKSEIIEIKSWNLEQAITMFNSLNSDNLPLNDADIISSKLYEFAKRQNIEEAFTNSWEEFHSLMQILEEKEIANIDQILMQYMYYVRTRRGETTNTTTPGLRRYFTDINKDAISRPMDFSGDTIRLANAWIKVYDYPCVQVMLRFNENAKLFLASYLLRFQEAPSEEEMRPVVESLLKLFTVMEIEETGYSSKYFKSFLFREEVQMADPNVSADDIEKDFVKHITENWNKDNVQDKIAEYDGNMLVYLNEYLYAKKHGDEFDLQGKWDIEHIMPASGRNIQTIRNDAGIMNEEEFKSIVNKLGNKIILEYTINRSIGNEWFRTKVSTTLAEKTGYINSKYPLAKALVDKYRDSSEKFWTKDDILNTTQKISNRIADFIFSE